jgi:hypothetical protein
MAFEYSAAATHGYLAYAGPFEVDEENKTLTLLICQLA